MAILRAKEPFSCNDANGLPRVVRAGDLFDAGDTVVKGREHLFEKVEVNAERRRASVEDTTAAPGEKRSVSTTRRRKTDTKTDEGDA